MKKYLFAFLFIAALVSSSCNKPKDGSLVIPKNKVWAHRVNTIEELRAKENVFDGMELDIFYSAYQNKLLVCHYEEDTINNLTLDQWFAAIKKPSRHSYWLDMKNLDMNNCATVVGMILPELEKYDLKDNSFIENQNPWILKSVKELGMHTSLWVENFFWNDIDTATWVNKVQKQCEIANPDALSCEWRMYGALTTFFPEKNIFLWHTPASFTPENAELTREMCQNKSVKIVLVDYDEPIDY